MDFKIKNGYGFQLIEHDKDGIFESTLDATYVIHLIGNGRYENILNNIFSYHTTKKNYILHNAGYKKSIKPACVINPPTDLVDAYLTIFKHAKLNNFKNILIFEDDYIMDSKILEYEHYSEINKFIILHNNDSFCYLLGCLPYITQNYSEKHKKVNLSGGTHAVIYSENNINEILLINQINIKDWDQYLNNKYMYYLPLCYQPFSQTENQKYWGYHNNKFSKFCIFIYAITINILIGDDPIPGFSALYKIRIEK